MSQLIEGTRAAFTELLASHPNEHFYFFALFTTAQGSYVTATAASEEGLTRVAQRYAASSGRDTEVERRSLRFSAPDSPFHGLESAALARVGSGAALHQGCFEALEALDEEGLFGRGAARDDIILNVVYGDLSDERWLTHARRLNGEASIARALPYLRLNLPSGEVTRWGAGAYQVNALSLSADRSRVAYSGSGGEIGVLDIRTRRALFEKRIGRHHWASVLSPDGSRFLVGDESGAKVLDVATGKTKVFCASSRPSAMVISHDGARLAMRGGGDPLTMRDGASGAILWASGEAGALAFAPDGESLGVIRASETGCVLELLDAMTGRLRWSAGLPTGVRHALAFAPDGQTLFAHSGSYADTTSTLVRIAAASGAPNGAIAIEGRVKAIAWAPSGARIGVCLDKELVGIDLDAQVLARGTGGQESLLACVFASDVELLGVGRDVNSGPAILSLRLPA